MPAGHAVVGFEGAQAPLCSWFHAFPLERGRVVLSVGRFRRPPSALGSLKNDLMGLIRTASASAKRPSEVIGRVNSRMLELGQTAEAVVAFFTPSDHGLEYASAGPATPALGLHGAFVAMLPASGGSTLGRTANACAEDVYVSLPPSSRVVLSTEAGRAADALRAAAFGDTADAVGSVARAFRDGESGVPADAFLVVTLDDEPLERFAYAFPAVPLAAPLVRSCLVSLAEFAGLDESQAFALQTAAGEAVANSVEHAYRMRARGVVRVSGECSRRKIIVTVEDDGAWRVACERLDERGRGFPLMRALVDAVEIRSRETSTTVRLTLRLSA